MEIAETDDEIMSCFETMKELRPNVDKSTFLKTIRRMQAEGYVLSYIKVGENVVSIAGFRTCFNLAAEGEALYVYDLVTSERYRSKGYGAEMLRELDKLAHTQNCAIIHLDSGVFRYGAHKFYLLNGFEIRAHHFLKRLHEVPSAFEAQSRQQK